MPRPVACLLSLVAAVAIAGEARPPAAPAGALPPGWLPIAPLAATEPGWFAYKKNPPPGPQLYLPAKAKRLRGVFVCYIFHSQDPRELADLWDFALLAIPPAFEFDIGFYDKRNPRGASGIPQGHMGNVLTYLDIAAKETGHPELATAPLVGWVGQNGGPIASDLFKRAPGRTLAWTDSWNWAKYPEIAAAVPLANAWELKEAERAPVIARIAALTGKPTPPTVMACVATTYGFDHGIYSKYAFFTAWLDRCIRLRLPEELPEPGKPLPLRALKLEDGWAGDYAPISAWNPIAPYKQAKGFAAPVWMPDEYLACVWRSYHSNAEDIVITEPKKPYGTKGANYSPALGNGFGGHLQVGQNVTFAAEVTGPYVKVEFYDGNVKLGEASAAPWRSGQVTLAERGVRGLYAVGVRADGTRAASRPALAIVE